MKCHGTDSWYWRSLLRARELLEEGVRKRVGNGKSIDIWEDRWLPDTEGGGVKTPRTEGVAVQRVSDLINDGKWDRELIAQVFDENERKEILRIPLSEMFSSELELPLGVELKIEAEAFHLEMPTRYPASECNYKSKAIWEVAPVSWEGLETYRDKFWHWWEELRDAVHGEKGQERIAVIVNLLWQIWKSRNVRQFKAKARDLMGVVQKAIGEWRDYQEVQVEKGDPIRARGVGKEKLSAWQEPSEAWVKINSDAAVQQNKEKAGWGLVARTWRKEVVGDWAVLGTNYSTPKMDEALALRAAMMMAKQQGWRRVEFESDCKHVIDTVNSGEDDVDIATVLSDIKRLKLNFYECCFSFTRRISNSVSHHIAKFAINLKETAK
ncbi:uncharacterized protein [Coffea arabica]|uniref:RNase H type-1 domain-containing protein n=1 Tax=Coffea arabica TaxID=13443 RepID=A0ABM4UFR4_COFAR